MNSSTQGNSSETPPYDSAPVHVERELWNNDCTSALLDEYEKVFAKSGRGHVKSKDWELIACQVNCRTHGNRRTPEQCKTKIEGLKKYYRKERLKATASPSTSRWLFFDKLSQVIGDTPSHLSNSTPLSPYCYDNTSKGSDERLAMPIIRAPVDSVVGAALDKKYGGKPRIGTGSDINVLDRIDFRRRLFEKMGLDRDEYQARMIDGFEDILMDSKVSLRLTTAESQRFKTHHAEPAMGKAGCKNSPLQEVETGNSRKARMGRLARKKWDYLSSLGKDIKEALSSFAVVIEKIEKAKMQLAAALQKQRLKQDESQAEMEVERTRMIMRNQLELAKLIRDDRKRTDGILEEEEGEKNGSEMRKKARWDSGVEEGLNNEGGEEESAGRYVHNVGKEGLQMGNEEFRSHTEGEEEKLDEYQEHRVNNLQGGLFGSKSAEISVGDSLTRRENGALSGGHPSYQVSGGLDENESYREDVSTHNTEHMSRVNGREVADWENGMGILWRSECHDLNHTINSHAMIEVGHGENGMEIVENEDEDRIAHYQSKIEH